MDASSAAALQRIYDRISQIEKDAQVVAHEYCRLLRLRAAGEIPPFASLTPLSQAAFRIADTSTQALVTMQILLASVPVPEICACCKKLVYIVGHSCSGPSPLAEEEDLYA
jgi:hypothetical protein